MEERKIQDPIIRKFNIWQLIPNLDLTKVSAKELLKLESVNKAIQIKNKIEMDKAKS